MNAQRQVRPAQRDRRRRRGLRSARESGTRRHRLRRHAALHRQGARPAREGRRAPSARSGRALHGGEQPAGQGHAAYRGGACLSICLMRRTTAAVSSGRARGRCCRRTNCRAMSCRPSLEALAAANVDAWVFIDDAWYLTNPEGTYVPLETRTVGYEGVRVHALRRCRSRRGRQDRRLDCRYGAARARGKRFAAATGRPRSCGALADLLSRRHEPRGEQGHRGARTRANRGRAARTRGRARRHGQRRGDVRDCGHIDRDGAGIRHRAASARAWCRRATTRMASRSASTRCLAARGAA